MEVLIQQLRDCVLGSGIENMRVCAQFRLTGKKSLCYIRFYWPEEDKLIETPVIHSSSLNMLPTQTSHIAPASSTLWQLRSDPAHQPRRNIHFSAFPHSRLLIVTRF